MKKRFNYALLFFILSVFSIVLPVYAYAQSSCSRLVLDDFTNSTNPSVLVNQANPTVQTVDDGSPGTLGAFRNITLGPYQGGSNNRVLSLVNLTTEQYTLNSDVGADAPVRIEYSADGAGLGLDISDRDDFDLTLIEVDNATETTLTLVDGNANSASLQVLLLPLMPSVPAQVFEFPFQSFTNIQNVDLSNIDSIELSFVPTLDSTDLLVENFGFPCGAPTPSPPPPEVVPVLSPAGYLLLALGVLLLSGRIFRQQ